MQDQLKQAKDIILSNKKILIVLPSTPTGDSIIAASVLFNELRTIADRGPVFDSVDFLLPSSQLETFSRFIDSRILDMSIGELESLSYMISFPCDNGLIEKVSYKVEDGYFKMFLASSSGDLKFEDVAFDVSGASYDLVTMVGFGSLKTLGRVYDDNKSFFDSAKKLSIGQNCDEDGGVGLVCESRASVSEVLMELLGVLNIKLTQETAQSLLNGIVQSIDGALRKISSSDTLDSLNKLMSLGAKMSDVVDKVSKTGTFSTLQLQQRVFANVKQDPRGILWSRVDNYELKGLQLSESDIDILEPIKFNFCLGYSSAFVIYELADGSTVGRIELRDGDALEIAKDFQGSGTKELVTFKTDKPISVVEKTLLENLGAEDTSDDESLENLLDDIGVEQTEEDSVTTSTSKVTASGNIGNISPMPLPPVSVGNDEFSDKPIITGDQNTEQFGPPQIFNSRGRMPGAVPSRTALGSTDQRGLY